MAAWIKKSFATLVHSIPSLLDMYMGTDAAGASSRRFAVVSIGEEVIESSSEEEDEEEERAAAEYWRLKKDEEEHLLRIEMDHEAEIKRMEAKLDPTLHAKVPIKSRKELEAEKEAKNKQGVRLRKTGARRKKFDPTAEKK